MTLEEAQKQVDPIMEDIEMYLEREVPVNR